MKACIAQMRLAFETMKAGKAINQPRRRLILPTGSVLHQMAGSCGPYFATKIYSSNLRHGGLHEMFVILYDSETGRPLAFIEANNLSLIRTGAATGYAVELLAAPDAEVLGIIGSGAQARTAFCGRNGLRGGRIGRSRGARSRHRRNGDYGEGSGGGRFLDCSRHFCWCHGIKRCQSPRDSGGPGA
jgi:ornithine cyclodeaminase/alanine dehydrogenase-like protein (mu-crystallin family)